MDWRKQLRKCINGSTNDYSVPLVPFTVIGEAPSTKTLVVIVIRKVITIDVSDVVHNLEAGKP